MPSRIDVELTSARPDGTWTWRAAGAREPKGVVESTVLPNGAKVGDVLKVEATIALDGIEIHSVVPTRSARKEPERIEIIGGREFEAVTTSLVGRRDRDDRGRGDRRDRRDGDRRPPGDRRPSGDRRSPAGGPRREGDAGPPRSGDAGARPARTEGEARPSRPPRERRERPSYAPVPELPQRPKPKRLKPGRAHRQAFVASLPEEQKPIAEQLLRAGLPGVRQALQDQNTALAAEGKPEINTSGIEGLAQDLLPRVRVAEWLDRADAARAVVDELDLRDLRSVVTAAADPGVARDDSTRELAAELRSALDRRQNEEHEQWLADIAAALDVGRVVRALRLSSRPPKAGVPFPPELGARLTEATTASLTADAASDRWVAVIEALAFAPVHAMVTPAAPPEVISDDLRAMVKGVAGAVPQIATLLGIEAPPPGSRTARTLRPPRRPAKAADAKAGRGASARPPGTVIPPPPKAVTAPAAAPPEAQVEVEVEVAPGDAVSAEAGDAVPTEGGVSDDVASAESTPVVESTDMNGLDESEAPTELTADETELPADESGDRPLPRDD